MNKINIFEKADMINFANIHHADFDGAISGACIKAALPNVVSKSSGIPKAYQNMVPFLNDRSIDIIILSDLSIYDNDIKEHDLQSMLENDEIIIYDHHLSENNNKLFGDGKIGKYSVLREDICGATISFLEMMKYFPDNQKLKDLEEIVYFSDVYDMWRIDNPDFLHSVKINSLLDWKVGYTPDEFRERFLNNPDPYNFSNKELKIIEYKERKHEKDLKTMEENAFLFEYKGLNVVMTESDAVDYTKMCFNNEVLKDFPDVDMFIYKYPNTKQCSVRIPENSKVEDLNDWTDVFGCAGHAKAGGISGENIKKLEKVLAEI